MSEVAITNSSSASRHSPIRVCILGSEGAGKTCFLAGLAILGEPNSPSSITATPRDSVTASTLTDLATALRRRQWPPATNMTTFLTIRVEIDAAVFEIFLIDYPGEDFRAALRTLRHDQIRDLKTHLDESDAILLLFDPHSDLFQYPETKEILIERQMAHLQAITSVSDERVQRKLSNDPHLPDLGIVLTKADLIPGLRTTTDARTLFQQHAGALDRKLRGVAKQVNYFALSSIGETQNSPTPNGSAPYTESSPQPFGYEELFRWILARHKWRANRMKRLVSGVLATVGLVLGALYYAYTFQQQQHFLGFLNNPHLSIAEKLQETRDSQFSIVLQQRSTLLAEELSRLEQDLQTATTEETVKTLEAQINSLRDAEPGALVAELDKLQRLASQNREKLLFTQISESNRQKNPAFESQAIRYQNEFPAGINAEAVRELLGTSRTTKLQLDRQKIRLLPVDSTASLQTKCKRIHEFLENHASNLEKSEVRSIRRALELGNRFCEINTYTITLKRSGKFVSPRWQAVWLYVRGAVFETHDSPSSSKDVTWKSNSQPLQWKSGDSIKLLLRDLDYGDEDVAWLEDRGPLALRLLGTRQNLSPILPHWREYCEEAFIEYNIEELAKDDWNLISTYLSPGEGW